MKNDTSQLPPLALAEVCRTSLLGAGKHGKVCITKGCPDIVEAWRERSREEIWEKFDRHMDLYGGGYDRLAESHDEEDGQHHLAACIFHLMTLLEKDLEAEGEDDDKDYTCHCDSCEGVVERE